jgi:hypothetical protein
MPDFGTLQTMTVWIEIAGAGSGVAIVGDGLFDT